MNKLLVAAMALTAFAGFSLQAAEGCYNQRIAYVVTALKNPADPGDQAFMTGLRTVVASNPVLQASLADKSAKEGIPVDLAEYLAGIVQRGCIKIYTDHLNNPEGQRTGFTNCMMYYQKETDAVKKLKCGAN